MAHGVQGLFLIYYFFLIPWPRAEITLYFASRGAKGRESVCGKLKTNEWEYELKQVPLQKQTPQGEAVLPMGG